MKNPVAFFRGPFFWAVTLVLLFLANPRRAEAIIDAALQMQLGNPSGAIADTNNHSHYLIQRTVEALDYNDHFREPNWAAWDLTSTDVGSSGRGNFIKDTTLPPGFYEVDTTNYSGSGYDRGHMCPSGDRTDNVTDNDLVFYMSNIIPQAPNNNQGVWANFETYCRTLASSGNEILIQCGPSGFDTNYVPSFFPAVATNTWKIVVVVPNGPGTALSRLTLTNRVITIRVPNSNGVSTVWQNFVTSAHAVELETGFNFFSAVPGTIASAYRSRVDGLSEPAPSISSFSPTSGFTGTNVTITGANFTSASSVAFNGAASVFIVDSDTQITATIPTNATTGPIVIVTPGGSISSAANFNVITGSSLDLAVNCVHAGNFTQGDTGDAYTLVVTNLGTVGSSGVVTISNALPAGLIATGISGAGWTCDLPTLTAARSDSLAANSAFPAITLTLNVATNAPLSVTNVVVISGGGDSNVMNNTSADATTINPASAPAVITMAASGVTASNANLNGSVNPNNQAATAHFEYGLTTNYGSLANIGAPLTGAAALPVAAGISNLVSGSTYHFRLVATNSLGAGIGLDQSFVASPASAVDLAAAVTHSGTFTQGDAGRALTVTVTNLGNAGSSGQVSVTNILPASFTATAMTGTGWTINLPGLTATRSDSLAPGAAYPPLILTVTISSNAPGTVTNVAIVGGGGDSISSNNNGNDVITINSIGGGGGGLTTLVGWDVSGQANFGVSPLTPTTNAANLVLSGLVRGSGVGTNGSGAAHGWGGNGWTNSSAAGAIASNQVVTFTVAASAGYHVSFSALSKFDYRHSGTGPGSGVLQYQLGTNAFVDIASLLYPSNTSAGGSLGPIDLSNLPALQNVDATTNVTFRIVNYGGTGSSGTWYIFDVAGSSAPDLALQGTVSSNSVALSAPQITVQPASQTNTPGQNVTFNVSATGTSPLSYQWRFNGLDLASSTLSSLTRTNVQSGDAGGYSVLITNVAGSITSSIATLTILAPPLLSNPVFSNQVFTFTISGNPGYNYSVESSTNLQDWSVAGVISNVSGQVSFSETNDPGSLLKVYRARLVP